MQDRRSVSSLDSPERYAVWFVFSATDRLGGESGGWANDHEEGLCALWEAGFEHRYITLIGRYTVEKGDGGETEDDGLRVTLKPTTYRTVSCDHPENIDLKSVADEYIIDTSLR